MPGQKKWDQGLWDCIEELFKYLVPHIGEAECTIIGDSAFGCFPMVKLCQKCGWQYLFRICVQHTCQPWLADGQLGPSCRVSDLVNKPGSRFFGAIRLWQDDQVETNLNTYWDP